MLQGMWDLSSPTRDGTQAPCNGSTGPPGKSKLLHFQNSYSNYI